MAGVWKRDGTIAVTKGSKKVVGTGTTFADPKNAAAKGHLLVMVTGTAVDLYEVDYSESNSVFYLVEAYRGDTGTGKAYAIDTSRTDSIPEFARRLNATLGAYQQQSDAFQALLTSDAATIEVTAPDGTKHTVIPWKRITSEGEGQAARAKGEADKATAAAAIAVNVVREAALPLPDVWIPFTDSLRMFAGYGREVKVGEDVVANFVQIERPTKASYFDKNGVWRVALENQPRIESRGLLIEGRSSNSVQFADKPAQWTYIDARFTRTVLPADGQSQAPTGVFVVNTAINTVRITGSLAGQKQLVVGDCLTSSCRFKLSAANINFRFRFANQTGFQGGALVGGDGSSQGADANVTVSIKVLSDGYVSASATMTCKEAGLHYGEFYLIAKASSDIPVGTEVRVQLPQIEPLPSRSSFIPTDSSEAVREIDKPWVPRLGNDNYFGPITIATEISCNGPGVAEPVNDGRRGIFSAYPNIGAYQMLMVDPRYGRTAWAYGDGALSGGGNQPIVTDGAAHTVVGQMGGSINRCYTDGVKGDTEVPAVPVYGADNGTGKDRLMFGYGAGGASIRHLWGHMRNVRIWHRALSDAQCKAIR
jgi:hypothetical protein